jgi:hypothetical protein
MSEVQQQGKCEKCVFNYQKNVLFNYRMQIELQVDPVLFSVKIEPTRVWSISNTNKTPIEPPVEAKNFYFSR